VVSRGPEVDPFSLPSFLGLDWSDALNVLARENIPFIFSTEDQPTVGQEGVIVSQSPDPGEQVLRDRPVRLTVRSIEELPEDEQFGIFDRTLPEYAVAVELSAVAVGPEGESSTLFNMVHPGGRLAFPYQLELGSTIVVYRYDTEVIRFVVRDEASED
jgi:beta-lactam-binding protein with PASTA domain